MAKAAVSIPIHLFAHPAYRALSPLERCLLVELLALGQQIGTDEPIVCAATMAANMCGVRKSAAAESLLTLKKKGFLALIKSGERRRGAKAGMASEYRLTCLPYRSNPPTCDYQRIHYKAFDRKIASGLDPGEKFLTREHEVTWQGNEALAASSYDLEAPDPPPRASFLTVTR